MSLKIGIVGLPNVGKSTLFKALTREQVNIANFPFATIDPNFGVVKVPDERLELLAEMSKSKKVIPAAIEFVDIAGLVKGAHEGAGLGNQFLAHIREVDAIAEVVRVFKNPDIIHVENNVNPVNDIEIIQLELAMADLETVNKHLLKIEKDLKIGRKYAQEEKIVLEKIKNVLDTGDAVKKANLSHGEMELVKNLNLLTLKSLIFVFNTSTETDASPMHHNLNHDSRSISLNLKLEAEIAEMGEVEAKEFKNESNLDNLIKTAYELLGLITYFTTGEDETRGWTIRAGSTAPEAGAAIHTDFKEKFIRAEVINWREFLECGSPSTVSSGQSNCWVKAREKGLLRVEGKEYVVCDGDIIEFKI